MMARPIGIHRGVHGRDMHRIEGGQLFYKQLRFMLTQGAMFPGSAWGLVQVSKHQHSHVPSKPSQKSLGTLTD